MKKREWIVLLLTIGFQIGGLSGQTVSSVSQRASIGNYSGVAVYDEVFEDSLRVPHGKFRFKSDPQKRILTDTLVYREMHTEGQYKQGLQQGVWKYEFYDYLISELLFKRSWNLTMQSVLGGSETTYSLNFNEGQFEGNQKMSSRLISRGRYGSVKNQASVYYHDDTIKGKFSFEFEQIKINGQTDKEGFLDGDVSLEYKDKASRKIKETRRYDKGFLVFLEKKVGESDKISVDFSEIKDLLIRIRSSTEESNYTLSDEYFGIKFNFAYQQGSKPLVEQQEGNEHLAKCFSLFDSIKMRTPFEGQRAKPTHLKFTRRVKFAYSDQDDSLNSILYNDVRKLLVAVESYLNKPNFLLRKSNSDTLQSYYLLMEHMQNKLEILSDLSEKVKEGYFDYRYRNTYYNKGIPGFDQVDTIQYIFNNKMQRKPFPVSQTITSPDSLLENALLYLGSLEKVWGNLENEIQRSLISYQNQELIDSLDQIINKQDSFITKQYAKHSFYDGQDPVNIPFSYKLFTSINERLVSPLLPKYLSNTLSQDEMITTGNTLICLKSFLVESREKIESINEMKKYWNDSFFTIYRPNPFDTRPLETKVLEGVQSALNILLSYYATQLLNAKNCEQLHSELNKIMRLAAKAKKLSLNRQTEAVEQLNRILRRERVPSRIERFLEL